MDGEEEPLEALERDYVDSVRRSAIEAAKMPGMIGYDIKEAAGEKAKDLRSAYLQINKRYPPKGYPLNLFYKDSNG